MRVYYTTWGAVLLWACAAAQALAQTHEFVLDNGLKVIVREDTRAPVVWTQIWYKVGSSDEPVGATGLSHVLEHMMFKATTHLASGEFSRTVAGFGGTENAFTSRDYTSYYQFVGKEHLEACLALEAERMQGLIFDDNLLKNEMEVVKEERRLRVEDRPESKVHEEFYRVAYQNGYSHPIIGWMRDLDRITLEQVRAWYQDWYTPNNAVLVVVGDVEPTAVAALAKKYFGAIQKKSTRLRHTHFTPIKKRMRVEVSAPAALPFVMMGFEPNAVATPTLADKVALDLLAFALAGDDNGQLIQKLMREEQMVTDVAVSYSTFSRLPERWVVSATPTPGIAPWQVEVQVLRAIGVLQRKPLEPHVLLRIKRALRASQVYAQDSFYMRAQRIGMLEMAGFSWRDEDRYFAILESLTSMDVQKIAKRYLRTDTLVSAVLKPLPLSPGGV